MTPEPPIPAELWDRIPPDAQAALLLAFARCEQRVARLEAQVQELQQRLGQNSSNSSRPPSSDPPGLKRAPPRPPSGRPPGGQPGHARCLRPLLPPTTTHVLKPPACRRCGHPLAGDDPRPLRHQVLELPEVRPLVTEYQRHRLTCPGCGASTCAALPDGVPAGGQGPRLQATLAVLTGAYRLSKRQVETLMADLFGTPVCAAQVCGVERQVADAVAPAVAGLRAEVRTRPANVDETSWPEGGRRAWLWVAVTQYVTLYRLVASRGADVVRALLGRSYAQTVTSDRFRAYAFLALGRRQLCWAHLRRDFQAMVDRRDAGSEAGRLLLLASGVMFGLWYHVRDGTADRAWFRGHLRSWLRPKVRSLLEAGQGCGCAKTAATCAELLALEPALWAFAYREGVGPTNNAAERALRHAVLWRRNSQGTSSAAGSRFVENILSVVETCRQQGRDVLGYVTSCCEAALRQMAPPSLLPATHG
jgi:transposase